MRLTPDSPQELETAVHESGHILGHVVTGWPFKLASIVPDADSLGRVEDADGEPKPAPEAETIVLLCGTLAVDWLFHSRSWVRREDYFVPDWANARLVMRSKLFPTSLQTADERAALESLAERVGARRLVQISAMIYPIEYPERSAAIEAELTKWARVAWRLVGRRWADIQALAEELMRRRSMTFDECLAVYNLWRGVVDKRNSKPF